ncbi:hypothetical protein MX652_02220 [Thauera aromatica]|nr:hypothetical protein [Thauera aromatica]MCK2125504.1 hypothetical protein [Thauera aromatica]
MEFSRIQGHSLPIGGGGGSSSQEMASRITLIDLGRGTVVGSGTARTEVDGDGDAGAQMAAATEVTVDATKAASVVH